MIIPEALIDREQVVIDSNILIYLFEDHDPFGPVAEFIVEQAEKGVFSGCITPITIAEIVVKPLQYGRTDLVDKFRTVIRHWSNIQAVDLTAEAGIMAGALKARHGYPLPDMIQAAVALQAPKPALISNDRIFEKIHELDVFSIEDFRDSKHRE